MNVWDEMYPSDVYLLVQTSVLYMNGFSDEFYKWFIEIFPSIDYQVYVDSLIKYNNEEDTLVVLQRIEDGFGRQTSEIYNNIINSLDDYYLAYDIDLTFIRAFIKDCLSEVNGIADINVKLLDSQGSSNIFLMSHLRDLVDMEFSMTPCKAAQITIDSLEILERTETINIEEDIKSDIKSDKKPIYGPYKSLCMAYCRMTIEELYENINYISSKF